jgi:CHAT domain-containing protein
MPGRTAAILLLLLASAAPALAQGERPPPDSVERCDGYVRDEPGNFESYLCYWLLARRTGDWETSIRRVEALLSLDPGNASALLARGALAHNRGDPRAEEMYRRAIEGFSGSGDAAGEVRVLTVLADLLHREGRVQEAEAELERALARAERSGEADLRFEALVALGWQRYNQGDFGSAATLLRRAEGEVLPGGTAFQQMEILDALAAVSWAAGRYREALEHYRREAELLADGDAFRESGIRRNMALVAEGMAAGGEITEAELLEIQRAALEATVRAGNRHGEVGARLMMARRLPGEEGLAEARRALALARELNSYRDTCWALWMLAERTCRVHPERIETALSLADEAVELARGKGDPGRLATGLAVRSGLHWRAGSEERGIADGLAALEVIEKVRDHQPDLQVRAGVFSRFAETYRHQIAWLALPFEGAEPSRKRLALAFRISERLRARSLLDALDAAGASAALAPRGDAAEERRAVLGEIAAVQSELMRARPGGESRAELLDRLEGLERDEAVLRDRVAREDPRFAGLRAPEIPDLSELRAALGEDQALLSYVVGTEKTHEGDQEEKLSWVLVLGRETLQALPVPDRAGLDREIRAYRSLLERRDGSEAEGAARLYRQLLEEALDALPAGVTRLLVIPDGPLHRLPFSTLRRAPGEEPLASRFEIQLLPSATAWTRWRRGEAPAGDAPVLSLADPWLGSGAGASETRSAGVFAAELRLGPLPHARREAESLRRRLGAGSLVLAGEEASEHALKSGDLSGYRLLHFAAHAVLDDEHPERAAVLLAPGSPEEDGLLQYREVVDLGLDGQAVLLSSCSSASGPVVGGEGVMGLASAFFQAGARTVVAGLWPLRDEEAADLVDLMGRRLARGESVGAALTGARRALIERGAPAASWAGLVVLGDADLVLVPGGRSSLPAAAPLALAGLLVALAAAGLLLLHRRRSRR